MRRFISLFACTLLAVFCLSGVAMAANISLGTVLNDPNYSDNWDTGAESVILTDRDGANDDATAFLLIEAAGYRNDNTFGIYGFDYDDNGNVFLTGQTLEIFSGPESPGDGTAGTNLSKTLEFNTADGTVSLDGNTAIIGKRFGFYITTPQDNGYIYYTHTSLNSDDCDHALIFSDPTQSILGSDVIIAFEDLYGLGDGDYRDMVVGVSDVTAPVPEPATMLLFGAGLVGLAGFRRKKS